jgi:hypothetical protein
LSGSVLNAPNTPNSHQDGGDDNTDDHSPRIERRQMRAIVKRQNLKRLALTILASDH